MSKVQLALPLVVGIVIRCLLPKKDFFCEETPSMDPVAPAAPTPVRPALSMDSLVAHVQHLKEPLEQIRREVEDSSLLAVRNYALKRLPAEGQTLPVKPVTLQQFQPVQTVSPCGKLCESCDEFCVPWNSHFFGMLGDCGHVCKIEPDGHHVNKSKGKFFDEFRKTVDCGKIWSSPHMDVPGEHGHPPRLSDLPKELVDLYTYGGKVMLADWYLEQKYYGTNSTNSPSAMVHHWKRKTIQDWIKQARAKKLSGNYGIGETNCLAAGLDDADLKGKSVLVIGSENPWVEALCLSKGAAKVTTLEYANLTSSHPLVDTVTPATLASLISEGKAPSFDAVVTFSSVEHSGLGRYGDALNPFGDLITMARAWCLAKPNADLVIGVMVGGSGQSKVRFNAHREYGAVSYAQLFANWQQMTSHHCDQSVYTLKKLDVI